MLNIFAIIVTYNGMQWIDRCLSMLEQSTVPIIPIIVDNCSTDGTPQFIANHYPRCILLKQVHNLGFGQANNVGICYARNHQAHYYLLLNQDAYLQPNAMQEMLKIADGHNLISPLHLNGTGTQLDAMFKHSVKEANNLLIDDLLIQGSTKPSYVMGEICAACWLLPDNIIQTVGGFNPLFFHYNEDNNYYHRLVFHGIKTILAPHAQVWHDRKLFGNISVYNKNRVKRFLILTVCNINRGPIGILCDMFRALMHCYIYQLPQHTYCPGTYLKALCSLVRLIPKIHRSRCEERKKQDTWLNLKKE